MLKVPASYRQATMLSADTRAMFAMARSVWDDLSPAMQAALKGSFEIKGGRRLASGTTHPTGRALFHRGLATLPSGWSPLTPAGMLVREVGIFVLCNEEPNSVGNAEHEDPDRRRLEQTVHELRNVLLPLNAAVDNGRGWMLGKEQLDRLNALGDNIASYLRGVESES